MSPLRLLLLVYLGVVAVPSFGLSREAEEFMAITKQLAVAAVEGKYRADFLRDLLTGRVEDVPAAVAYARSFGWELDRPTVVVVAELDPGAGGRPVRERFASAWQAVVRSRDRKAPVVDRSGVIVNEPQRQRGRQDQTRI